MLNKLFYVAVCATLSTQIMAADGQKFTTEHQVNCFVSKEFREVNHLLDMAKAATSWFEGSRKVSLDVHLERLAVFGRYLGEAHAHLSQLKEAWCLIRCTTLVEESLKDKAAQLRRYGHLLSDQLEALRSNCLSVSKLLRKGRGEAFIEQAEEHRVRHLVVVRSYLSLLKNLGAYKLFSLAALISEAEAMAKKASGPAGVESVEIIV